MELISCSVQCGNENNIFQSVVQALGYIDTICDDDCQVSATIDVKDDDEVVTYQFEQLDDILESMMNL